MSTRITLTYCGMAGEGSTVREAKQDAARKIEAFLGESFTPVFIRHKDHAQILWRTPTGINSALIHPDTKAIGGTCFHGPSSTMEDEIERAKYNLATLGADVASDEVPVIIANNKTLVREFAQWLGFQRAYREHRKANAAADGSNDAHVWACTNAHVFAPSL